MTAPCPTFGFTVVMDGVRHGDPAAQASLRDAWIGFLESRGLCCTARWRAESAEYVVRSEASQATEGDRVATQAWLASRRDIRSWRVGPLDDVGAPTEIPAW